jgi:cell division protein FtsZ
MMSNSNFKEIISFDLQNQSNVIKVIGVGGGSDSYNHVFKKQMGGLYCLCNTDSQALQSSSVNKIQLGVNLLKDLVQNRLT